MEVSVRGGNLIGVKGFLITGAPGVTAELVGGNATVDEKAKPLYQSKCTVCHEARSPANRSLSPEQWASTVDRMINSRGADINKADRDTIVAYLQALAKAGQVTAKVTVAPNAAPGMREVRLVTASGASTAWSFEIGAVPEVIAAEPNSSPAEAQKVTLPVVVNGALAKAAEKDFFTFDAKKGQRLTFNLKGFRLNEQSQAFFNPALYLYDAKGKEVAKSLGHFSLDPLIDWTAPEEGTYTLLVRDLLWHGSPSSVYRLAMGPLPYDGTLLPAAGRPGSTVSATMRASLLTAENGGASSDSFMVQVPQDADGLTMVSTPMGDVPFLVSDLPDGGGPAAAEGAASVALPALFRGVIARPGQTDTFRVKAGKGGMTFEVFARRLGSPLRARVVIKDPAGKAVQDRTAEGDNDLRIPNAFPNPGEYTVEVRGADEGQGGPQYAYHWEATAAQPEFALLVQPDNLSIAPGETKFLLVRATRRENLRGPITLSVKGLPPGVTASEAVIPPDDDKALIVLTAAPGTATAAAAAATTTADTRVVQVEGRTPVGEGATAAAEWVTRRARPLEIYRVNNNPRTTERSSQVISLVPDPPPFTLEVEGGENVVRLLPNEEAKLTVKVVRQGNFKGDVTLILPALPPGITAQNALQVPAGKTEGVFLLRANGNARFLNQPRPMPDLPPMQFVVAGLAGGRNNDEPPCSTAPIAIAGKTPPQAAAAAK